jgi:hypothetical protein
VLKIRLIKWYTYYNIKYHDINTCNKLHFKRKKDRLINKKRAYYKANKEITNILNIIRLLLAFIIAPTSISTPRDIYKD